MNADSNFQRRPKTFFERNTMKKILIALLCLSVLLLPGFTSQDPEINKACEVAEAYLTATKNGDIDTMLKFLAKEHRDNFIANNTAENPWFKLYMIFQKKAQWKIAEARWLDDENIEAHLTGYVPNVGDFLDETIKDAEKKLEPGADYNDALTASLGVLEKHMETISDDDMEYSEQPLSLIKEDGEWKVVEDF